MKSTHDHNAWIGRMSNVNWRIWISLLLIIITGICIKNILKEKVTLNKEILIKFPNMIGSWECVKKIGLDDNVINTLKLDEYIYNEYRNKDRAVYLYIGYYKSHRRYAEIHTPEHCQMGSGWELVNERKSEAAMYKNGVKIRYIESIYEKDKKKMVFIYWYQVNGECITNHFYYKAGIIWNSIINKRSDASFVRIVIPVLNNDVNDAVEAGKQFLMDAVPIIDIFLL